MSLEVFTLDFFRLLIHAHFFLQSRLESVHSKETLKKLICVGSFESVFSLSMSKALGFWALDSSVHCLSAALARSEACFRYLKEIFSVIFLRRPTKNFGQTCRRTRDGA